MVCRKPPPPPPPASAGLCSSAPSQRGTGGVGASLVFGLLALASLRRKRA